MSLFFWNKKGTTHHQGSGSHPKTTAKERNLNEATVPSPPSSPPPPPSSSSSSSSPSSSSSSSWRFFYPIQKPLFFQKTFMDLSQAHAPRHRMYLPGNHGSTDTENTTPLDFQVLPSDPNLGVFFLTFSGVKSELHFGYQKVTWKKLVVVR